LIIALALGTLHDVRLALVSDTSTRARGETSADGT
jgi:hypothetical protein